MSSDSPGTAKICPKIIKKVISDDQVLGNTPTGLESKAKICPIIVKKNTLQPSDDADSSKFDTSDEDEAVRNKRLDRSVAMFERNYFRYISVKTKLNTFLNVDTKDFGDVINFQVENMNHMIYLSYLLLNYHFIRIIQKGECNLKKITQ